MREDESEPRWLTRLLAEWQQRDEQTRTHLETMDARWTEDRRLMVELLARATFSMQVTNQTLEVTNHHLDSANRTLDLVRMDIRATRSMIRRMTALHRAERREFRAWLERFFGGRDN